MAKIQLGLQTLRIVKAILDTETVDNFIKAIMYEDLQHYSTLMTYLKTMEVIEKRAKQKDEEGKAVWVWCGEEPNEDMAEVLIKTHHEHLDAVAEENKRKKRERDLKLKMEETTTVIGQAELPIAKLTEEQVKRYEELEHELNSISALIEELKMRVGNIRRSFEENRKDVL